MSSILDLQARPAVKPLPPAYVHMFTAICVRFLGYGMQGARRYMRRTSNLQMTVRLALMEQQGSDEALLFETMTGWDTPSENGRWEGRRG